MPFLNVQQDMTTRGGDRLRHIQFAQNIRKLCPRTDLFQDRDGLEFSES